MKLHSSGWEAVHDNNIDLFGDFNIIQNNCIYSFCDKETVFLFHATTQENYTKILKTNCFKSSGGCLVASLYCTPIFIEQKDRLRLHNLGGYYYFREIPMTSYKRYNQNITAKGFIIKIKKPKEGIRTMGINYIDFGRIHYDYIKFCIESEPGAKHQIVEIVNRTIIRARRFIKLTNDLYQRDISYKEALKYLQEFNKASTYLQCLGYALFEVVSQYIILNQNDKNSMVYKQLNEIYNWNYKDMFFSLFPSLLNKFDLEKIYYNSEEIANYIKKNRIICNFNEKEFTVCICHQLLNILYEKIFINLYISDTHNLPKTFDYNYKLKSLVGHIGYRYIKKEFSNIYSIIERKKAEDIWRYWTDNNITLVYNNYISKGELGINPIKINEMNYEVYECNSVHKNTSGLLYVEIGKKTNIRIQPKYIPYEESLNR